MNELGHSRSLKNGNRRVSSRVFSNGGGWPKPGQTGFGNKVATALAVSAQRRYNVNGCRLKCNRLQIKALQRVRFVVLFNYLHQERRAFEQLCDLDGRCLVHRICVLIPEYSYTEYSPAEVEGLFEDIAGWRWGRA